MKIYGGIRLYKIGANTETENILIQYIPEEYIWKNIYTAESNSNAQLDRYLEAIKQEITSKQYLEVGAGEDIKVFYGDEVEETTILPDEVNEYFKVNFFNNGVPIYIAKSMFEPSDYRNRLYLRSEFYFYDSQNQAFEELSNLSASFMQFHPER